MSPGKLLNKMNMQAASAYSDGGALPPSIRGNTSYVGGGSPRTLGANIRMYKDMPVVSRQALDPKPSYTATPADISLSNIPLDRSVIREYA